MLKFIYVVFARHISFWSKENARLLLRALLFFIVAILLQHFAYDYIDNRVVGIHVGDVILDNLPTLNLDIFIVQGALITTLLVVLFFIIHPQYLSFALKALAFFIIIRSFFISLTHLGTNLNQITLNTNSIGFFLYDFLYNAKNDFFFSGHVGAPFLFALIFLKKPFWRNLFFLISAVMATAILFSHFHYSIDVFAAPFITYGIYMMAKYFFKKDFLLTETAY